MAMTAFHFLDPVDQYRVSAGRFCPYAVELARIDYGSREEDMVEIMRMPIPSRSDN